MNWQLPARPLSPPDTAEEHDMERCEDCGELVDDWHGCRCAEDDAAIDEAMEADDG